MLIVLHIIFFDFLSPFVCPACVKEERVGGGLWLAERLLVIGSWSLVGRERENFNLFLSQNLSHTNALTHTCT